MKPAPNTPAPRKLSAERASKLARAAADFRGLPATETNSGSAVVSVFDALREASPRTR